MAGVAIIHAQEDSAPAQALAAKLRAAGLTVAADLQTGTALRRAISQADAVAALWSPRSAGRTDLIDEAVFARNLGRLIHDRMQNTPNPAEFSGDPSVDLTGWRGEDSFQGWINLRAAIDGVIDAGALPAENEIDFGDPEPLPPPPPPRRAERAPPLEPPPYRASETDYAGSAYEAPRSYASEQPPPEGASPIRLAIIGIVTFLVVAGVGIGGYSMYQNAQGGASSEAAWAALDKTDPLALRAFLDGGRAGAYREEAEAALEGLEIERLRAARDADTISALQAFLDDFPDTRRSTEVRGRIAELRQLAAQESQPGMEELPKEGEDPLNPGESLPDSLGGAGDDMDGAPVGLLPPPPQRGENLSVTEEELRRALTGEDDRAATEEELRQQIQRGQ